MVAFRFVAFALVVPFLTLSGCEDEPAPTIDAGVPDLSTFIGCDPTQGTMTNPACPASLPQCHPAAHICVGCIPSSQTCLPGFVCSENSHVCEPLDPTKPCTRNVDCPVRIDGGNPLDIICQMDTGKCVQCVHDEDCVDPVAGGVGVCYTNLCNPDLGGVDAGL
jgi:hypothetical protein